MSVCACGRPKGLTWKTCLYCSDAAAAAEVMRDEIIGKLRTWAEDAKREGLTGQWVALTHAADRLEKEAGQ